jgi:hypothetical protein
MINGLDESNKFFAQIQNAKKIKELQKAKRKFWFAKIKMWTIRILIYGSIFACLFFPVETGTLIGHWIHDFSGSIYKNIIIK